MYETGNILTNLRISLMQSEEESEKIAEGFLSGLLKLVLLDLRHSCFIRVAINRV